MPTNPNPIQVNARSYAWPQAPRVVVCVDGSAPAYIEQAVAAGVMPWTERTLHQRGVELLAECVVPSFTNPNNMSIVTGVSPAQHGICGNFYYDKQTDTAVMMNDPKWLRVPTIFKAFQRAGAKVVVITAKDKLRRLLGHELHFGREGAICFSSEKAAQVSMAENGIDNVVDMIDMAVPSVYSAELSEFIFKAGVELMRRHRPQIMYLSTTDYIQHKFAPGSEGANAFYRMLDGYWQQLDALGAIIGVTADHGMNAKHDSQGRPNIIYLQTLLDQWLGHAQARVILPITDPYVVHHGALGSYATVYLDAAVDLEATRQRVAALDDIDLAVSNRVGCERFGLAPDRMGDLIIVSSKHSVIGTSEEQHDLSGLDAPLRSHGGISEQTVPLIFNRAVKPLDNVLNHPLRNFDVFDIALNQVVADG